VHSLYLATELGGSGYWYLLEQNNNVLTHSDTLNGINNIGLGVRAQRFAGVGPRVQVVFSKKRVMLWAVPVAFDPEVKGSRNSVAALRLSF
jgi:peroxiredoxin